MINIDNSFDLLLFLKKQNLIKTYEYWWPNENDFEILIGAVLTQNTRWQNVEKSLENLRDLDVLNIEKFSKIPLDTLVIAITPSGFKNQKAPRLKQLSKNIIKDFGNFNNFKKSVKRSWLLSQKGIGNETADAILCYVCKQDYMVVDKYTAKLLQRFGYEFDSYEALQEWIVCGINESLDKIYKLYGYEISINKLYARLHGKIVEYMKLKV